MEKTEVIDAHTMSTQQFIDKYSSDDRLTILDADNLLNYNTGYVNIDFEGVGVLLFHNGECIFIL